MCIGDGCNTIEEGGSDVQGADEGNVEEGGSDVQEADEGNEESCHPSGSRLQQRQGTPTEVVLGRRVQLKHGPENVD